MTDLNKPLSSAISQVASSSHLGKTAGTVGLIVVVVLMVWWSLLGSHESKKQKDSRRLKTTYRTTDSSDLINVETGDLSDKIRQMREKLSAEKLAQEEKLYKIRQAAPIAMYTASNTVSSQNAVTDQQRTQAISENADSRLPLSANQIDKLKRLMGVDADSQFQQNASHTPVETVDATQIAHTDYTVMQGTLIPGSLQTAINSDLPGMVKATVSRDVYASSGDRVLIPKGSTLIGQYNSGLVMGQKRVLVAWTRVIRPDGIDALLGSPGTDALGQGGLGADTLDTHFWARFGQASLLSIIGSAIATAGVSENDAYNSASAYRTAMASNFQSVASSSLLSTMNIKPTVHVYQGARINVFVNRDVSFYNTLSGHL